MLVAMDISDMQQGEWETVLIDGPFDGQRVHLPPQTLAHCVFIYQGEFHHYGPFATPRSDRWADVGLRHMGTTDPAVLGWTTDPPEE